MLETAWEDGWVPQEYEGLVRELSFAAKKRSALWAWYQEDYDMLRLAVGLVPRSEWNLGFMRFLLGARLPTPLVRAVRRGVRSIKGDDDTPMRTNRAE